VAITFLMSPGETGFGRSEENEMLIGIVLGVVLGLAIVTITRRRVDGRKAGTCTMSLRFHRRIRITPGV
jgi:hypothetical protein